MQGFEHQESDLDVDSGPGAECRAVDQCPVCQNEKDLQAMAAPTPVIWQGTTKCSKPVCVHTRI